MVSHAPNNQLQSAPTMTDKTSERRTPVKVTVAYWLLGAASATYALYAVWILGGMAAASWEKVIPPQANHVILTTLALIEVAAIIYFFDVRRTSRGDDQFVITSTRLNVLEATVGEVRTLLTTSRGTWDDPTIPNVTAHAQAHVYRSSSVMAVHSGRLESLVEGVAANVAEVRSNFDGTRAEMAKMRLLVEQTRKLSGAPSARGPGRVDDEPTDHFGDEGPDPLACLFEQIDARFKAFDERIEDVGRRQFLRGYEVAATSDAAQAPVREAFMHGYELAREHDHDAGSAANVVPIPAGRRR